MRHFLTKFITAGPPEKLSSRFSAWRHRAKRSWKATGSVYHVLQPWNFLVAGQVLMTITRCQSSAANVKIEFPNLEQDLLPSGWSVCHTGSVRFDMALWRRINYDRQLLWIWFTISHNVVLWRPTLKGNQKKARKKPAPKKIPASFTASLRLRKNEKSRALLGNDIGWWFWYSFVVQTHFWTDKKRFASIRSPLRSRRALHIAAGFWLHKLVDSRTGSSRIQLE